MCKVLKIISNIILISFISFSCHTTQKALTQKNLNEKEIQTHLNWVQMQLRHPEFGNVLVSAHRGDWRNAPENSLQSLKIGILKGFDIIECDLAISKDGQLIIMHDKTIDRTTTGKGKPSDYTLSQLKQFNLRNATGHPTAHTIPTLREFLMTAKGKAMICIDKGFEYFDQAMELVDKYDMQSQIIYNVPNITLDSLKSLKLKKLNDSLIVNVLGFPTNTIQAKNLTGTYNLRRNGIMHPTFNTDTLEFIKWMPQIKNLGLHLWINSLWPEHCGGHDDDRAIELNQQNEAWGWIIKQGATIIQTDRPAELIQYLKKQKLHY